MEKPHRKPISWGFVAPRSGCFLGDGVHDFPTFMGFLSFKPWDEIPTDGNSIQLFIVSSSPLNSAVEAAVPMTQIGDPPFVKF